MTDLENQETGRNFELPSKLSGLKDLKHIDGFQAPHLHQDETTTRCVPHYMRPSKLRATLLRAVTPQTHGQLFPSIHPSILITDWLDKDGGKRDLISFQPYMPLVL